MYGDALTTKARIKDRLQITVTTFDDLLDNLILAVTARMEQMTGRRFTEATFTNEIHDGSDVQASYRSILIPKHAPLQAITSIQYNAGRNSDPDWTTFDEDEYDVDYPAGLIYFRTPLPQGFRNIRITYTGGWSGYSMGITTRWTFNATPSGTVNGVNLTFTLPENAEQVVVYVDGLRESTSNVTFTAGTDTFTLAAGRAPFSTIAVDYKTEAEEDSGDLTLPADLVAVCEAVVVRIFKRRDSEGRQSETFQESSITWRESVFTKEDLATIKNYRRGYHL